MDYVAAFILHTKYYIILCSIYGVKNNIFVQIKPKAHYTC